MFRVAGVGDLGAVLRLYRQLHPGDLVVGDGVAAGVFERILGARG